MTAPEILVSSRDRAAVPPVRGADIALSAASAAGWTVTQAYSKARVPAVFYADRRPAKPEHELETVSVRFVRSDRGAGWATWVREAPQWTRRKGQDAHERDVEAWSFDVAYLGPRRLGARELLDVLRAEVTA